jgi:hypothetical protein
MNARVAGNFQSIVSNVVQILPEEYAGQVL